jgi:predicted TPR repeat methyltransferase
MVAVGERVFSLEDEVYVDVFVRAVELLAVTVHGLARLAGRDDVAREIEEAARRYNRAPGLLPSEILQVITARQSQEGGEAVQG